MGAEVSSLTLVNDRLMIYDNFLPQDAFVSLAEHAGSLSYQPIQRDVWQKAWHLTDGKPLKGTTTYFRDDASYQPGEVSRYPTRSPLDALIEAISGVVADAESLIGKRGISWSHLCVSPYLHPRGSGLSLHRDHTIYTGAFTYYAHQQWDVHWGGHLLVLDSRAGAGIDLNEVHLYPFLSDRNENQVVCEPGLALCVLPKPNRLVFLKENAQHMITRVDADAGDRPRVTFAGFFFKV